jgi:hypothetical protein
VSAEVLQTIIDRKTAAHTKALEKATAAASETATATVLEALGFSSLEEAKAARGKGKQGSDAGGDDAKVAELSRRLGKAEAELDKRNQEIESQRTAMRQRTIRDTVTKLSAGKTVDADLLSLLVVPRIGVDEAGGVFVRDAAGDPDYTMTPEQLIDKTLAERPHLAAGPSVGGSGGAAPGAVTPQPPQGVLTGFDAIMQAKPDDPRLTEAAQLAYLKANINR